MHYFYGGILSSIVEEVYGVGICIKLFLMCIGYLLSSIDLHTGALGGLIRDSYNIVVSRGKECMDTWSATRRSGYRT